MVEPLIDPALLQFVWTASVSLLLLAAAGLTLAMLPWTDHDIALVDHSFQNLVNPSVSRATLPR